MPYASGRVIHDADAHIMEVPGFLERASRGQVPRPGDRCSAVPGRPRRGLPHAPAGPQGRRGRRRRLRRIADHAAQELGRARLLRQAGPPALRSTFWASPASSCSPRRCSISPRCWRAKVTSTCIYAVARAHTRHMVDFCSVDKRLLPTGYVPLADFERTARGGARGDRARRQGAADPVALPGQPFAQPYRLRSAVGDAPRRPACRSCFHVGGGGEAARGGLLQQRPAAGARLPRRRRQFQVDRLHGDRLSADEGADGADRRSRARPLPAAEIRRHRAGRLVGAGLDAQHGFGAQRLLQERGAAAEDVAQAQRVRGSARCASRPIRTRMPAGSSPTRATRSACSRPDYPHVEGGRNPIKRFEASMAAAGTSERQKQRFYCDNFVDLMGAGLAPELRAAA